MGAMTVTLLLKLFCVGFLINMAWEVWHSQLYTTCLKQTWTKNVRLLTIMSLKDALFITLFYGISFLVTKTFFESLWVVHLFFVLSALTFSFIDEKISVARGRWEYAPSMPTLFGVGITPLLEIALTGLLAFLLASG